MAKEVYLAEQLSTQNFSALTELELLQDDLGNINHKRLE